MTTYTCLHSTPKFAVSSYCHWSVSPGFHSVHLDSLLTPKLEPTVNQQCWRTSRAQSATMTLLHPNPDSISCTSTRLPPHLNGGELHALCSALHLTCTPQRLDMTKHRSSANDVSANDWRAHGSGQFGLDDLFRSDEEEGRIDGITAALASGIVFEYVLSWSYGRGSYLLVEVGPAEGYQ
jgi:hypothetical protein